MRKRHCYNATQRLISCKYAFIAIGGLLLFIGVVLLVNHWRVPDAPTPPAKVVKQIEKLLIEYNIPGAQIAVIQDGNIKWRINLGYADILSERPVRNETLFQAASITKTLTAAAVLQTSKTHQISLDSPVNNYLKRWQIPTNQYSKIKPVTIRMLLNHTAAISNPYPDGGYGYDEKLPSLLDVFQGNPPATNQALTIKRLPGEKYEYCNGCYSILQMFLEDVDSMPYPLLMKKLIFKPTGMKHSFFDNNLFLDNKAAVALPYNPNGKLYTNAPLRSPIYSTGFIWTTASDLAKYIIAVQYALHHNDGFISKDLAKELITPDGSPTHGLAFFISDKFGEEKTNGKYFMHSGANLGYLSIFIGSNDGKHGAVILINSSPEWDAKDYPQFGFIKKSLMVIADEESWS